MGFAERQATIGRSLPARALQRLTNIKSDVDPGDRIMANRALGVSGVPLDTRRRPPQ
jgi:hypothetical protein